MTRIVFYNRVSVEDRPDPQESPDGQLARLRAYIEARGWADIAVYAGDRQGDAR
jgi:hypothetical protein